MSDSWAYGILSDLVADESGIKSGPFGTVLSAAEYGQLGVPVISVGEVGYGDFRLRSETPRVGEEVTSRLPEYLLREGDIVFGRKGAVDRSAWVSSAQAGWFLGSDALRVRTRPDANSRFVAFQLRGAATRDWLLQHAGGSTLLSLNQGTLARVPVVIPPLSEQQAIAEVLGALDDKIAANTALATTADSYASTLLLGSLSADRVPLNSIARITMGSSPKGETLNEQGDGVPFYQGVRDYGFRSPTRRVFTTSPVRLADPGDILVSVRAPVGDVNVADEGVCIGRGIAAVRSTMKTQFTLFHQLKAERDAWEPYEAEGTVFGSINRDQLQGIQVRSVTRERADVIECQLAALESFIAAMLAENRTLAATRDALLPGLMSGKLLVHDVEAAASQAGA